ncbi:MAG: ATP-dependent DNA ligase [Caldilineaceae bacterium]
MQKFTQLYAELDETNKTNAKVAALEKYFQSAPPADAAWALYYLTGNRQRRVISGAQLRDWVSQETGFAPWLVEESYHAVGDMAETVALLLSHLDGDGADKPLHQVVQEQVLPLADMDEGTQRALVVATWRQMDTPQRFVWHKLITGSFRVGVGRTLVVRALANVAGIDKAIMAHRLMGEWQPTADAYRALLDPDTEQADHSQPYPFYLAYQFDGEPESLGAVADWQIEWKWDGIRAQVIKRSGDVLIWSRGEELVTDAYPEVAAVGELLADGTVLDGELLAWQDDEPLPFNVLQQRIGRKRLSAKLLKDAPVAIMTYDLLEWQGADLRSQPLRVRRERLAALVGQLQEQNPTLAVRLSPVVQPATWADAAALRAESRAHRAEGFMLKRLDSPYQVGRIKGDWWKWKIDPFTVDAVMIYAQRGSGRRASLYTDYTFAVWDGDELVPFAKAYSGLTDAEIQQVDAFVRRNTKERFGPVRSVTPELVMEIAFEGIQKSTRHKSGVALRFPRIARWRKDKPVAEADTIETLRTLLAEVNE